MNLQHHFLIATPALQDPFFKRSVVYLCEHNEGGAMGLVINKPAEHLTVNDLLRKLKIKPMSEHNSYSSRPVFIGGPLAEDRGFILHTPQEHFNSSIPISAETMVTTSRDILESIGTEEQPENVMVALGYSSWQPGQLESELLDNAWLTVEADA
ncbi:MAG: YqgE/AlgH family protein, partial [Enterobacteriaceae bacterium]